MITKYVRNQLIVFTVLTLIATGLIVFVYAHIPTNLGYGQMTISAVFSDGAGIYKNGNVALRGVDIGRVTDVSFTPDGVKVTMAVDDGARIGADARAEIHSVSAVGEQYVNLVATDRGGPYLRPGAVIPISRTSVPNDIATVLDKTDTMLASVPNAGLQTFLDEGYRAFRNLGPSLGVLADSTGDLVDEANRNYDQTVALLNNVGPLLDTQVRTAGSVRSYFADLAGFTRVLRDNDRHLRRGIRGVGPAGRLANRFIEDNENTVPILTSNMRTLGQVLGVYRPSVEQVLVSYPLVIAWEQIVARNHRGIHAAFEREVHEVCSTGFDPGSTRSADAMADAPATPNAYCKVPHNDPRDVRGARNVPCLEGHVGLRAGTVDECFGREPRPNGPAAQTDNAPFLAPNAPIPPASFPDTGPFSGSGSGSGSASASGFGSGFGSGSGDPLSMLGAMGTPPAGKDSSWRSMLMAPLAH